MHKGPIFQNTDLFITYIHIPVCFLQIVEPFFSRLKDETFKLLTQCEEGFEHSRDDNDYSVYTGSGGWLTLL